jgi:hypothetical protein
VNQIRALAQAVAHMERGDAQVRALDTLAQLPLADKDSLEALVALYLRAPSVGVQRAVAGVLVRADTRAIATPGLVQALQKHRLQSEGPDMVDVLLRRLKGAAGAARPS